MNFFNITLTWIGVSWKAPASQVKIEMLRAENKEAAKARVAQMFIPSSWKITEMVQL